MKKVFTYFKKGWGFLRHILSIRGLLDWLGWKQQVGVALLAVLTVAVGYVRGLSWLQIFFGAFVILCLGIIAWRAFTFEQAPLVSPNPKTPNTNPVIGGPEVVVNYSFEDRKAWDALNKRNTNPDAPLVLRNISANESAYNVRVLPLTIEGLTATFEPKVIPYIEPKSETEVFANVRGASPIATKAIPTLLRRSYKDESVDELFGTKSFTLLVQYEDASVPQKQYQSECDILYRPWKQHVDIGTIRRKLRAAAAT